MPIRPARPCNHPGCPRLVRDGSHCPDHAKDRRQYDQQRGSSTKRLYDYQWQKASKAYLQRNPLCMYCQRQGRITAATVVDHRIPHRGDPVLFWDEDNWQGLCTPCHSSIKQSEENRSNSRPR